MSVFWVIENEFDTLIPCVKLFKIYGCKGNIFFEFTKAFGVFVAI